MTHFDHVIVGQGLAGTTLAWALRARGFRVCVIDRGEPITSSRIAAGLITPVTGLRMAPSWRYAEFFPAALAFYERIERETGSRFFQRRSTVRLFLDAAERKAFVKRADNLLHGLAHVPSVLVNEDWFANPHGGFEMPEAARLDAAAYLDASRDYFVNDNAFRLGAIELPSDVEIATDAVHLRRFDIAADRIVFCQGFEASRNPFFPGVPFNAIKGEVLALCIPGLAEDRVIHRGIWLAPAGGGIFLAGSTSERKQLDNEPTETGRDEICSRLREFLCLPFEVVDHRAAVRPVMLDGRAVLGWYPQDSRLGYFNGLGSKGALLAPFFAEQFAAAIAGKGEVENEVALKRLNTRGESGKRLD